MTAFSTAPLGNDIPGGIPPHSRFAFATSRVALSIVLCGLAALSLGGCARGRKAAAKPATRPPAVILDYNNGWFHKANGTDTISQIAHVYNRDAELLAQVNRTFTGSRPPAGTMLYIPPTNDRETVHRVLERIQGHPELVPKIPWNPNLVAASAASAAQPAKPIEKPGLRPESKERPAQNGTAGAKAPESTQPFTPVAGEKFQWPVQGRIVSPFKEGWHKACHGIEIAVPAGSTVRAARSGRILTANRLKGYENVIIIDHLDGFMTTYGYNDELLVKAGDVVRAGQEIARAGGKSRGDDSLLFFQIRQNSSPVDPLKFLN